MVSKAWHYSWSSARAHTGKKYNWITLSNINKILTVSNWKQFLEESENKDFLQKLRMRTKSNMVLGAEEFILKLERLLNRKILPNPNGRPQNKKSRVRP